jgi:hypothetical protein
MNMSAKQFIMGLPATLEGKFVLFIAAYYSFFATGLMISPNFFFGPDSPMVITTHFATTFDDKTILFARFFAGTALSSLWAPFLISIPYPKWCKILLINNIFVTLIYTWALFVVDPAETHAGEFMPKMMWYSEYALGFGILALNGYIVKGVAKEGTDMI